MINGRGKGPDLSGLQSLIWMILVVAVIGLLYVLNRELDGALWPW